MTNIIKIKLEDNPSDGDGFSINILVPSVPLDLSPVFTFRTVAVDYFDVTILGNKTLTATSLRNKVADFLIEYEFIVVTSDVDSVYITISPLESESSTISITGDIVITHNSEPPVIETPTILCLSPYYITIPFISPETSLVCERYTVNLFVWKGQKATPPDIPSYSWTKGNPTASEGYDRINISNMVSGLIGNVSPLIGQTETGVLSLNNQAWVKYEVVYDSDAAIVYDTAIALKGYGFGMSGVNPTTPETNVLCTTDESNIYRTGFYIVPILIDGLGDVTVKSYPDSQIDLTLTPVESDDSLNKTAHVFVNASGATTDEYIEVIYNEKLVTLWIVDECRYTPTIIEFLNRFGQMQMLTFFKAKSESMSTTGEEYDSHAGQPKDGFHQYTDFNINGRSKFKANTGFIDENENPTVKELMLSSRAWLYNYDGTVIPVKKAVTNIEYKSRQKDRLINYEIEFTYAFDEINTI